MQHKIFVSLFLYVFRFQTKNTNEGTGKTQLQQSTTWKRATSSHLYQQRPSSFSAVPSHFPELTATLYCHTFRKHCACSHSPAVHRLALRSLLTSVVIRFQPLLWFIVIRRRVERDALQMLWPFSCRCSTSTPSGPRVNVNNTLGWLVTGTSQSEEVGPVVDHRLVQTQMIQHFLGDEPGWYRTHRSVCVFCSLF